MLVWMWLLACGVKVLPPPTPPTPPEAPADGELAGVGPLRSIRVPGAPIGDDLSGAAFVGDVLYVVRNSPAGDGRQVFALRGAPAPTGPVAPEMTLAGGWPVANHGAADLEDLDASGDHLYLLAEEIDRGASPAILRAPLPAPSDPSIGVDETWLLSGPDFDGLGNDGPEGLAIVDARTASQLAGRELVGGLFAVVGVQRGGRLVLVRLGEGGEAVVEKSWASGLPEVAAVRFTEFDRRLWIWHNEPTSGTPVLSGPGQDTNVLRRAVSGPSVALTDPVVDDQRVVFVNPVAPRALNLEGMALGPCRGEKRVIVFTVDDGGEGSIRVVQGFECESAAANPR